MEETDILHVEVCQNENSKLSSEEIEKLVFTEISKFGDISCDNIIYQKDFSDDNLKNHVESILCCASSGERSNIKVEEVTIKLHVYRCYLDPPGTEIIENDDEDLPVSGSWVLPTKEFNYLWENLHFDSNIKNELLYFVASSVVFSDHKVNTNIVSWNNVILLHGPPGTGKTSLCKALAQKIIIRMGKRFRLGTFIEINSHSLFSKWFSESGKLVMKLFNEIKLMLEDTNVLFCILIDEIESLAHARKLCSNETEPTDSIRVVNALLTQLDQIKKYPNVLILTTSNLSEAIDLAFIDRADIKQYIGLPSFQAIYKIYSSCLEELMRVNLMEAEKIYDYSYLKNVDFEKTPLTENSLKLIELSHGSIGFSGRTLRKLPFLAHAFYLRTTKCTLSKFLQGMHLTIEKEKKMNIEQNLK